MKKTEAKEILESVKGYAGKDFKTKCHNPLVNQNIANYCIDEVNKEYWQTGKPTTDGIYEVYLGNNYYETRSFFGDWSKCWNPSYQNVEIIAWHLIPPYEGQ